jgi:hypothetical protein
MLSSTVPSVDSCLLKVLSEALTGSSELPVLLIHELCFASLNLRSQCSQTLSISTATIPAADSCKAQPCRQPNTPITMVLPAPFPLFYK